MARFLKRGMDASAIKAADAKVRETVESILAQVDEKKDLAIRELSKQFDNWEPKDCSAAEIEQAVSQVSGAISTTSACSRPRSATSRRSSDTMKDLRWRRPASSSATATSR